MSESGIDDSFESFVPEEAEGLRHPSLPITPPDLPIFSILDSIDFSDHFVLLGEVGTGKSTVVPIHEFEKSGRSQHIVIREPSRASCNALYYSLEALHPEIKDHLAIITKDTKINIEGEIKIVTDGVLIRMLADRSVTETSIYFDESHQMSSQLELCMSLAKKDEETAKNLFRVMSATIDPEEFLAFLGISKLHLVNGRRYPVNVEVERARDLDGMFDTLSRYLYTQPRDESWLVFLPTRRLVERYAGTYGGVYIHGGLEGSEVNRIQRRAERDKNLKIFATNVIASSVNIYVDNVLIFNDVINSKDRLGQKTLRYSKLDNNSLLQMIGRIGRFKPGRAVILTDSPIPNKINPTPVRKCLETETPFDLVLLMSKYGLDLSKLEFMSRVNHSEITFAEGWLSDIGAIEPRPRRITRKGLLMSEIPYEPDFAHMISGALISGDYQMARFLLACGSFGDSLNHAYRIDFEPMARDFLYNFDSSNELNIKAHILKRYSEDASGSFKARMIANGIFPRFVEEAWKNYEAARDSLNDFLLASKDEPLSREVVVDPNLSGLEAYLADCLSFERYDFYEKNDYDLRSIVIEDRFYARSVTVNFRKILFDVVALNRRRRRHR
ncbi:MAG TPA: helicase-related protein [Nitrososphaerales archaeon]|nr:helicase-related protein [Nitrososphaerales archaeon]